MFDFLNLKSGKGQNKKWRQLIEGDYIWKIDKTNGGMNTYRISKIEPVFDYCFNIVGWKYTYKLNWMFKSKIDCIILNLDNEYNTIIDEWCHGVILCSSYKDAKLESEHIRTKIKNAFDELHK